MSADIGEARREVREAKMAHQEYEKRRGFKTHAFGVAGLVGRLPSLAALVAGPADKPEELDRENAVMKAKLQAQMAQATEGNRLIPWEEAKEHIAKHAAERDARAGRGT